MFASVADVKAEWQARLERRRQAVAKYARAHPERIRERYRKWLKENRERELERHRRRVRIPLTKEQMDHKLALARKRVLVNPAVRKAARDRYRLANPDKVLAANARRRAHRIRAVPLWADQKAIVRLYEEARRLSKETGLKHVVDHIIPLRSRTVCGLHVADNLQVIPEYLNNIKGNR